MNTKTFIAAMLGLVGTGPLAGLPDMPHKTTYADLDRIEKARQKRLRKQAKRLPPEMG